MKTKTENRRKKCIMGKTLIEINKMENQLSSFKIYWIVFILCALDVDIKVHFLIINNIFI